MLRLILTFTICASAFASDLTRAPQAFTFQNSKAIYVDFLAADYEVVYDLAQKKAQVTATIRFQAPEEGYPIFDLRTPGASALLNGAAAEIATLRTPDNATTVRALATAVPAGEHTAVITTALTTLVSWENGGVHSATWTTDLSDRGYLEQYMPANMEFDRVPMTFKVKFLGAVKRQIIYANGVTEETAPHEFKVSFPAYFTASSVFFHTVPEGVMAETRFQYRSVDGRELPVVIYLKPGLLSPPDQQLARLKADTIRILEELEGDYGPFLHPSVTIYNAGSGGMEYCGATMTSHSALGHELTHSYFARGMIPANGNSGWIDEAIASWRDNGYPRGGAFRGNANMAGRAPYTRATDTRAYSYGASFMSNLDNLFAEKGGLKTLLREVVAQHAFKPFWTEDFVDWAEGHYRMSVKDIFQRHVYQAPAVEEGTAVGGLGGLAKVKPEESVHHQKLTLEELADLL